MDVELDEVGAELDRTLERRRRVLGQFCRRSPVSDRPRHPSRRRSNGTSIVLHDLVGLREPLGRLRPEQGDDTRARRLRGRDAGLGVLEDERLLACRAECFEREQVALGVRLAENDVVVGDDGREQLSEPGCGDDRDDLLAGGAGDDRELRALGGETHCVPHRLGHRRSIRDRAPVTVDPLPDKGGNARVARAEADLGNRVLGETGETLVVLAVGDRLAVLGEELAVDPAEDRLVLGERAVEIEDHRPDRHVTQRLRSSAMPLSALLLALAAAFVHAFWNLLLARARDPEAATAVALIVAVVVFAPVSLFAWSLEREVWPYLVVTSCLQLLYFSLLITAYRRAEMSVVYPVARGVAPDCSSCSQALSSWATARRGRRLQASSW